MGQLTAIEPNAVDDALVDDNAAALAEINPVHVPSAIWAFEVAYFLGLAITVFIDVVDVLQVYAKDAGNRALQNQFYFAFIEKQAEAGVAALNI